MASLPNEIGHIHNRRSASTCFRKTVSGGFVNRLPAMLCFAACLAKLVSASANAQTVKSQTEADPPPENIALHRPYVMDPPPNYPDCADPDDSKQLTDGMNSTGAESSSIAGATNTSIWLLKSTVGWKFNSPAIISICAYLNAASR